MATYYIGLMSGTSLDGIDAVIVDFSSPRPVVVACYYQAFPSELRTRLKRLCFHNTVELSELGSLDAKLGVLSAQTVNKLLAQAQIPASMITAIGSHGQTVYHAPQHNDPFTIQIGDPNRISQLTGIPVIADFRRADIAAGGQGAPLVPAFHRANFQSDQENRVVVNIGGIANITILPKDDTAPITGFDTGPGNTLLDFWVHKHKGIEYDVNSRFGRSGRVCQALLEIMLSDNYFSQPAPKSTGQEYFSGQWMDAKLKHYGRPVEAADIQATLYQLTTISITDAIQTSAPETQRILLCGGGAHNKLLMEKLSAQLAGRTIETTEAFGIKPDWVEATAFAWLAFCFNQKLPGNLPSVTGASHSVILGGYYFVKT